jgi:hypothetical protein
MLMTTPEKKNGTARQTASWNQMTNVVVVSRAMGESVI